MQVSNDTIWLFQVHVQAVISPASNMIYKKIQLHFKQDRKLGKVQKFWQQSWQNKQDMNKMVHEKCQMTLLAVLVLSNCTHLQIMHAQHAYMNKKRAHQIHTCSVAIQGMDVCGLDQCRPRTRTLRELPKGSEHVREMSSTCDVHKIPKPPSYVAA